MWRDRRAPLHVLAGSILVMSAGPMADVASAQKPTAPEPCNVLTKADVEAVVGEELKRSPRSRTSPTYGNTMTSVVCTYRTPGWTVALHIERGRTREELEVYLTTLGAVVKQTTGRPGMTPVAGLGDRAWWGPVNPTNGMLHVVKGTDVIWLQTHGQAPGAGSLEKTKALMQKALAKYRP